MGASSSASSASGFLDEAQSASIKERAEAELSGFVPYYRKQMSAARFSELENQLEPGRQHTHRLKHKESPQAHILYEGPGLVLDQNRKWRERYLVVRGNHRLESHEGLEGFLKGVPPVQVLVPSGGSVWTSLDLYVDRLQRSFPALGEVKEEFTGFSGFSGSRFLVFLDLPHRRHVAFCFKNQDQRDQFCRVLEDCIRHQNHDFLKRQSPEVEAFVRAVRFYQQQRGQYRSESLLIGSIVRVLSNLVMEQLLPEVQQDLLDRLRAPRGQRTQTWLTVLEEVYVLLDSVLLTRFSQVQQELQDWIRTLEPSMTSDLDLIRENRNAIRCKVQASMSAAAERLITEKVTPHLSAMLAALIEPVSDAFLQGCRVSRDAMDAVCQSAGGGANPKKLIASMPRANLQSCYQMLGSVSNKLAPYAEVFGFPKVMTLMLIDRVRLDLQQLVENVEFTFQQILLASDIVDPESAHKAKQLVLQHFDYDSSIMRKKIIQEALITITLPYVKEQLDRDYRTEIAELQHSLDSDSTSFVVVDNEYEDIIIKTLIRHVTKAITDPTNLEKFKLIPDLVQEKSPAPEPGTIPEIVPDQESVPETGSGPEPDSRAEQKSVTETGSRPESEARPEQASEPEPASVSEPGPEQEHRPEPQPFVELEARPELDPGKEPEPSVEPEPAVGPRPEDGSQQELGPQSETGPDPVPDPEPDPSSADASLAPDCVRAISELVVLNLFPDVIRLED